MSKNNKIIIGIISTLCLVIILSITYAAFTGQLQINGTANVRDSKWDIHIVESGELDPTNITGSAKVLTKPTASTTSLSDFALSLTTPGDAIEYTFNVINEGDYDAEISTLTKNGVTCTANGSTSDPEAVKVCNKLEYTLKYDNGSTVSEGDTILSKETKTLVLKIKYQEFDDPTLLPTTNVSISGLGITLAYRQKGDAKVNADGTTPYVAPTYTAYVVGDVVTLGGENFYVIEASDSSSTTVKLLAEYNVQTISGEGQYTQSASANKLRFDDDSNDYEASEIKTHVDAYKTALEGRMGKVTKEVRLMLIEEVEALGQDMHSTTTSSSPEFINEQSYWLGSPYEFDTSLEWFIDGIGRDLIDIGVNGGTFNIGSVRADETYGLL